MDSVTSRSSDLVIESTRALIEALKSTGVVQRFAVARQRYASDPEVQSLVNVLQQFQRAQQTGEPLSVPLEEVKSAQQRFQRHPVVKEFFEAQEELGSFLQETNEVVSELIGVNIGQMAGPAGGAC